MHQPHDIRNLIQVLTQLGRTTTKRTIIDSTEVGDGDMVDSEVHAAIRDGVVEIQETLYQRRLACGHITTAGNIAASCDLCGRKVCPQCFAYCANCGICVCRYCFKVFKKDEGEETLCSPCHIDAKRKSAVIGASRAIFGLFGRKKE